MTDETIELLVTPRAGRGEKGVAMQWRDLLDRIDEDDPAGPILREAGMPVAAVLALLEGPLTPEEVVATCPGLVMDDVFAALTWREIRGRVRPAEGSRA